jgi:hypothetical protein
VTDSISLPLPVAAFRGPVTCRRTANLLTLTGAAADSADDRLILTFISPSMAEVPHSLAAAAIHAVDEHHYRIACASGELMVEATSLHVHRDIGSAFYRAVPPRPAPLGRRIFWRLVLALAGTRAGKRLLLSLRRQA